MRALISQARNKNPEIKVGSRLVGINLSRAKTKSLASVTHHELKRTRPRIPDTMMILCFADDTVVILLEPRLTQITY